MAITSAIMQMRKGNEVDFDPDKMHPGEWAVSTDEKYVRMCFSPGVCVRMATYEAFEEDMEQIIAILEEAKTVQEAIEKIYEEFQKAELDIEAAENSAILSKSYAIGGTNTREGEDTDNAKYYAEKAKELKESFEFPVSIENGGTGGTTAKEAQYNLLNDMVDETASPITDNVYIPCLYVSPTKEKGTLNKRGVNTLWNYIKSKMGDICSRTVKSANAVTHSNYPTDNAKVPDMSFMSYWNGAYSSNGGSNLTYCKHGAFGTMATKNAANYTPVANLLATTAGKPLDATMGKTLGDKIAKLEESIASTVSEKTWHLALTYSESNVIYQIDGNLSEYDEIMVCLIYNDVMLASNVIPISLFKTIGIFQTRVVTGTSTQTTRRTDITYKSDTTIEISNFTNLDRVEIYLR